MCGVVQGGIAGVCPSQYLRRYKKAGQSLSHDMNCPFRHLPKKHYYLIAIVKRLPAFIGLGSLRLFGDFYSALVTLPNRVPSDFLVCLFLFFWVANRRPSFYTAKVTSPFYKTKRLGSCLDRSIHFLDKSKEMRCKAGFRKAHLAKKQARKHGRAAWGGLWLPCRAAVHPFARCFAAASGVERGFRLLSGAFSVYLQNRSQGAGGGQRVCRSRQRWFA